MAKVPLIIAIILMGATGVVGFLTKSKIEGLRGELTSAQGKVRATSDDLIKKSAELKTTTEALATTKTSLEAKERDVVTANEKAAAAARDVEGLKTAVDTKDKRIAELELAAKPVVPGAEGVSPELAALQKQVADLTTENAELKTVRSTLESRAKSAESEASSVKQAEQRRAAGIMRRGLEGRVLAVNQGFNFVVIDIGDKRGAAVGGQMVVQRGGNSVARVKITSVEPSTAIADIMPGTLARGAYVKPGDTVIFEGDKQP